MTKVMSLVLLTALSAAAEDRMIIVKVVPGCGDKNYVSIEQSGKYKTVCAYWGQVGDIYELVPTDVKVANEKTVASGLVQTLPSR